MARGYSRLWKLLTFSTDSCFCLSSFLSLHKVIPDSWPPAPLQPLSLILSPPFLHLSLCLLLSSSSPRCPQRIIVKKQPGEELPRENFIQWSVHLSIAERARFINPQSKTCPQWRLEKNNNQMIKVFQEPFSWLYQGRIETDTEEKSKSQNTRMQALRNSDENAEKHHFLFKWRFLSFFFFF